MVEFRHYSSVNLNNKPIKLTIASGPVIIEGAKVLLDKHGEDEFWKFPGGAQQEELSPKENAIQEVKRELGVEVEIKSKPFVLVLERDRTPLNPPLERGEGEGLREYVVLIHYLAQRKNQEIKPAPEVREYAWHDINNLPKDLAPNIIPVVKNFTERIRFP